MTYKDRTFCGSPHCENKCGRKMTELEMAKQKAFFAAQGFSIPVSYSYFCGEPKPKVD